MQEWPAHMTTRNRTKLGREKVLLEQGIRFSDVIKSLVCPQILEGAASCLQGVYQQSPASQTFLWLKIVGGAIWEMG